MGRSTESQKKTLDFTHMKREMRSRTPVAHSALDKLKLRINQLRERYATIFKKRTSTMDN